MTPSDKGMEIFLLTKTECKESWKIKVLIATWPKSTTTNVRMRVSGR